MFCNFCTKEKEASAFYVSNKTKCKECVRLAVKENRNSKLEYYKEFDRARANLPSRVLARKSYAQTEAGKSSHRKSTARWKNQHPKRRSAQIAVGNAVRDGKLIPWSCCALPECGEHPQAHHADYDRPLDVVWLCAKHHSEAHNLIKEINE